MRKTRAAARSWRDFIKMSGQRPLLCCLLVAAGYFLLGRAGQLLTVPPSYATAIWPPSGIALAAILLFGNRVLPGIFLGAFLVNGWIQWNRPLWTDWDGIVVPMSISLGVTAQAFVGAWLVKRVIGFPNPLIHDRQILIFLALGGPVACVLGATWGVATLASAGELHDFSAFLLNWCTWWGGDVIGVIIFAPLTLICFARPRELWRPRCVSVALPLSGAMAMIVLGFALTRSWDESRTEEQFRSIAGSAHQLLDDQLDRHLEVVESLHRYLDFSQFIKRGEFARMVDATEHRCAATETVAWVSREITSRDELASLAAGRTTIDGSDDGGDSGAGSRTGHADHVSRFSVAYLYPETSSFLSMGQDFATNPNWTNLMRQCCDSGQPLASRPFLSEKFLSEQDSRSGERHVLVLAPVYQRGEQPATVAERRRRLRGFIVGVFGIAPLVRNASPLLDAGTYRVSIYDVSEGTSELVHEPRADSLPRDLSEVSPYLRQTDLVYRAPFAGRQWECHYSPTDAFYKNHFNGQRRMILGATLGLVALLGTFLLILSGRTAKIEASEARYLDLYENAPDMFISMDVRTQRVIECNRTFLDSTGFQKQWVIDKQMDELFDPSSRIELRRAFREFLASGHVSDVELRLRCADGGSIDTSVKMSVVRDQNGESIVCRAALRDITARKRVEADLKTQEMQLAHAGRLSMMGEMAAGLAHEINQPLAAIAAYAEGASIRLRDGKPDIDSLNIVLQRIATDAHRAGQVIRRLRQFLRKRTPERTSVQINDLVREVASFVYPDLRRRDVRLGIDLGKELPPVQGDPIQLQQVLLNLVRNGADAMLDTDLSRRQLMIRTRCSDGESVDVTVEDFGHGLSTNANDELFEAFYSTKDDGLGMGLAISRSIIESHGGQIWATSNPQRGATFYFSLPATAEVGA
jgi:PAS domain S-box-containing protein